MTGVHGRFCSAYLWYIFCITAFSALQSTTRTGALNVLYGLKSGGGESKGAVLKWGGESKEQF